MARMALDTTGPSHPGPTTMSSQVPASAGAPADPRSPPMRILRIRPGFQADHSSSSYLFYAVDGEVSEKGQQLAETFSSSAEVDEQYASFQKYGESKLS